MDAWLCLKPRTSACPNPASLLALYDKPELLLARAGHHSPLWRPDPALSYALLTDKAKGLNLVFVSTSGCLHYTHMWNQSNVLCIILTALQSIELRSTLYLWKQAERLKSLKQRPDKQWSMGMMIDRDNGQWAPWLMILMGPDTWPWDNISSNGYTSLLDHIYFNDMTFIQEVWNTSMIVSDHNVVGVCLQHDGPVTGSKMSKILVS